MEVGFAGAGNMSAAMARGWAGPGAGPDRMMFCDLERDRAAALADEVGGEVAEDLSELAGVADLVVLGVKPNALGDVAAELAPAEPEAILSMLAATPVGRVEDAFPGVPVIRVMPNQPVEVRRGVLCYSVGSDVPEEVSRGITDLLGLLGTAVQIPDERIEAAMAIMSCSPAYVAMLAEILTDAGVREGLGRDDAALFVAETLAGTGELLRRRDADSVRRSVAPPGGATEAGLEALEGADLRGAVDAAVEASLARFR
jgi:pyrroline-5-carboxylate reductase